MPPPHKVQRPSLVNPYSRPLLEQTFLVAAHLVGSSVTACRPVMEEQRATIHVLPNVRIVSVIPCQRHWFLRRLVPVSILQGARGVHLDVAALVALRSDTSELSHRGTDATTVDERIIFIGLYSSRRLLTAPKLSRESLTSRNSTVSTPGLPLEPCRSVIFPYSHLILCFHSHARGCSSGRCSMCPPRRSALTDVIRPPDRVGGAINTTSMTNDPCQ